MFRNYIITAVRALLRNKYYTLINVLGLSLGIASCILIFAYLRYDVDFNKAYQDADQIYRTIIQYKVVGQDDGYNTGMSAKLLPELEKGIPGIVADTRLEDTKTVTRFENNLFEEDLLYADPQFFDMFTFKILRGNPDDLLTDRHNVVISSEMAEKYFPGISPIGKDFEIQIDSEFQTFIVSGVFEKISEKTAFSPSIVIDFQILYDNMIKTFSDTWGFSFSQTYIKLAENADPMVTEDAIHKITEANGLAANEDSSVTARVLLQPLPDIHLNLNNPEGLPTDSDTTAFWVLFLIGVVILLIASINFTSLTMGYSTGRAREVGVRKVLGSSRGQVMRQFWIETAIISLLALIIGLTFAEITIPLTGDILERDISFAYDLTTILFISGLWLLATISAGLYPSLVISGFAPVQAITGKLKVGGKRRLRRLLVFAQLSLSICLIAVTMIMSQQLHYMQAKKLGFNGEQVISIPMKNKDYSGEDVVKHMRDALNGVPGVISVAGSSAEFGNEWAFFDHKHPDGSDSELRINFNTVTNDFFKTMQIEFVQGGAFKTPERSKTFEEIIINEKMAEILGYENPIGQELPYEKFIDHEIVGVVKDFHFGSMRTEIKPLVFGRFPWLMFPDNRGCSWSSWLTIQRVLVRVAPDNIPATLNKIGEVWREVVPDKIFDYKFVDEKVDAQYREDRRWNTIISIASILAISIAAMGLIGLTMLEVSQRTREIGIRKVLGASVANIVSLLSREATILVIIASAIAIPSAWFLMQRWLEAFAFRISVSPLVLVGAALIALAITWFSVSAMSWKAANMNPADAISDGE